MSDKDRIIENDGAEFPVAWRATLDGFTAEIRYEEHIEEFFSPREADNLGTMVCWHPDYYLGDEQIKNPEGRGAVRTIFETERGRTDFRSMETVERYLKLARGAVVTIPLYLLDHSGISMSAGEPSPFDNPRVKSDHHGNSLGFDTTHVGYIYTTRERIEELCGPPQIESDPFYCPRTWTTGRATGYKDPNWKGTAVEWIVKQLQVEVSQYDSYLRGNVVFTSTFGGDPADNETVGGFLPDTSESGDGFDYLRNELRDDLVGSAEAKREADAAEAVERDRAARMDVATVTP